MLTPAERGASLHSISHSLQEMELLEFHPKRGVTPSLFPVEQKLISGFHPSGSESDSLQFHLHSIDGEEDQLWWTTGGPGKSHCCPSSFPSQITSLLSVHARLRYPHTHTHLCHVGAPWEGQLIRCRELVLLLPHEKTPTTENTGTSLQPLRTGRDMFSTSSAYWDGITSTFCKSHMKPYLRWCSPGIRGTGLWRSAAPNWTSPPPIRPAAPAWTGRFCCWLPCRWSASFRLALPWPGAEDVGGRIQEWGENAGFSSGWGWRAAGSSGSGVQAQWRQTTERVRTSPDGAAKPNIPFNVSWKCFLKSIWVRLGSQAQESCGGSFAQRHPPPPSYPPSCFCCWTSTLKNRKVNVIFLLTKYAAAEESFSLHALSGDIRQELVHVSALKPPSPPSTRGGSSSALALVISHVNNKTSTDDHELAHGLLVLAFPKQRLDLGSVC